MIKYLNLFISDGLKTFIMCFPEELSIRLRIKVGFAIQVLSEYSIGIEESRTN